MTFFTWSQTASSNNTADTTINWREGQAPSTVNNSTRAMMAALAKWRDDSSGALNTGGSSTAYTVTSNQTYTSLSDGVTIVARLHTANGTSPTLNVDSLGAKAIRTHTSTAVLSGAMNSGGVYSFTYDSGDDCWYVRDFYPPSGSFSDASFQLTDDGDATKIAAFQCSGITTATTRTLTIPDASGTILLDGDIGTSVQAFDADTLKADTPDTLTAGFAHTVDDDGTQSSGTYTPDQDGGNMKQIVNGGAFTLAPPTDDCCIIVQITNNASAGTITTSGFSNVFGDSFTTTDGDDFICTILKINGFSSLTIQDVS